MLWCVVAVLMQVTYIRNSPAKNSTAARRQTAARCTRNDDVNPRRDDVESKVGGAHHFLTKADGDSAGSSVRKPPVVAHSDSNNTPSRSWVKSCTAFFVTGHLWPVLTQLNSPTSWLLTHAASSKPFASLNSGFTTTTTTTTTTKMPHECRSWDAF